MSKILHSLFLPFLLALAGTATGQEAKPPAQTVGDATVAADREAALAKPVDTLRLQLRPLFKDQLEIEAEAWLAMLRALDVDATDLQIAYLQERAKPQPDAQRLTQLQTDKATRDEEKIRMVDRVQTAVRALRAKGGETEVYDAYVAAVSGLDIDVKDASAAWTAVLNWLQSPEGGIRWGLNIVLFLLTLLAARLAAGFLGKLTLRAVSRMSNVSDLLRTFFVNSVRNVTFLIGLVIALSMLEIDIGPLVAGLGVAGFVLGFALQGTLSNFASGVMILLYRPYDVGNFVEAGGVTGTVHAMTLVSTTLKTPDNQTVVIPNNSIWGGIITNVTGSATRRVDMKFGVGYGDDLATTQRVLEEIVAAHPLVLAEPAPVVRVHELADSSVNLIVRPWAKTADYWQVYWDLTRQIKERFDAEGISIPFPQRDVHLHQVAPAPA